MELRVENLGKQYGDTWAVRDVTARFTDGVVGLLGPNGAGKSTLMRMLTTVTTPTTGAVYWNDTPVQEDPDAIRSVLGYLPQDFGVYPDLTVAEFLEYVATLRGVTGEPRSARVEEMLTLTNLRQYRDRKLRTFSGGMRQRAGIAQALVNDPELLIVDEPTVGLDPQERVRFRNILSEIATDRVVILSTHIVPDVEATANQVALLSDGELLAHTDPESLAARVDGNVYECTVPRDDLDRMREAYQVCQTVQEASGVSLRLIADEQPSPEAELVTPTLEDAYLARVGGTQAAGGM